MTIHVTPIPSIIELTAPAFELSTANIAGAATTAVASDSELLLFDAVLPDAITYSQAGSAGAAAVASRRDHAHAMAAAATAATEVQMEDASSTTVFATPGRTQYHPGVGKAYCRADTAGTLLTGSYNVASITVNPGLGNRTYVWDVAFADTNYGAQVSVEGGSIWPSLDTFAVGSLRNLIRDSGSNLTNIPTAVFAYGAQ